MLQAGGKILMYKQLPHGVKMGITRSIVTSFEDYMKKIEWREEKFDMQHFLEQWKDYIYTQSTWIHKVDDKVKEHADFHQALATKVNEKIAELVNEDPTEEQVHILKEHGVQNIDSFCKLEAQYRIDHLIVK